MTPEQEILTELQDLGSPLAALCREMPYATPDNYFSTLPDELSALSRSFGEAQDAASIPAGLAAEGPFEVPSGYFSTLPSVLAEAARKADGSTARTRTVPLVGSWRRLTQWAAAAVIVIGLSIAAYQHYNRPHAPEVAAASELSRLSPESIETYVELHVDEFDSEVLESSLLAGGEMDMSFSGLEEGEIQAYLSDGEAGESEVLN